ncbi:hypothetical protein SPN99_004059 [Vibrio fluvialis]|nr:hypothetical protein [Vibrio fluvialis]ELZ1261822.1 hypothetical protein [Vibrio fluvialis]
MNLAFIRQEVDAYTKACSDLSRQMAFAGIAILWVLSNKESSSISTTLLKDFQLWFFAAALMADLLQYIVGSVFWFYQDRLIESKLKKRFGADTEKIEAEDFEVTSLGNTLTWILFFIKVGLVALGYITLLVHLW